MLIISVLKLSLLIFILLLLGGATIDCVERRRRNSDSAVYFDARELPLSRLKCLETEVKYLHNRIALLEDKKENWDRIPLSKTKLHLQDHPIKILVRTGFEIIYSVDTVRPKSGCLLCLAGCFVGFIASYPRLYLH